MTVNIFFFNLTNHYPHSSHGSGRACHINTHLSGPCDKEFNIINFIWHIQGSIKTGADTDLLGFPSA